MTALSRQNALFVSENWERIYEAIQNVDFRAYDMSNLSDAIYEYLKVVYPDEFNDWIASSEFIMKVEILTWLSQNLAYRVDLNARENFLATAERRESLLRLASLVAYKINRVRSANGDVKVVQIRTNQPLLDSDNVNLANRGIVWNDPKNDNWFEQFITVMNAAFDNRNQFGRAAASFTSSSIRADQYEMTSISPSNGSYTFNASVNGSAVNFDLFNAYLDTDAGLYKEMSPGNPQAMSIFYKQDGKGFGSPNTGFFFPIKQGTLQSQDALFTQAISLRTITLSANNVNDTDVIVQQLDENDNVIATWTEVDTIYGEGVSFNTSTTDDRNIFEVDTLVNDQIRIRFGDGAFGAIPMGRFRFWTRSAIPNALIIKPSMIRNQAITMPYISGNQVYYLQITFSLQSSLVNAAPSETNDDIRTRANKLFYTQNRMVTAQDYNNFYFKDNSIIKVKTVNRTYAGHSRYTKLHDPTGLYENVRYIADDGRLYQQDTVNIQTQTANTITLPTKTFVDTIVKPILQQEDKRGMFYSRYPELFISGFDTYKWDTTEQVGPQSTGNILKNDGVIPVGPNATDDYFKYLTTDALFRYKSVYGPVTHVTRLIDNGTAANGIVLEDTVPDGSQIVSVFPAFRSTLLDSEEADIENAMGLFSNFGIRWDYLNQAWKIIAFNNLDETSPFSVDNAGNTDGTHLDASWMVKFVYKPAQNGGQAHWEVTDRGVGLFFESSGTVNFYYSDNDPVIDPVTGAVAHDTIRLLPNNESRDSLRRRGIAPIGSTLCGDYAYTFVGNGTTKAFQTGVNPLDPMHTIVLVNGIANGYLSAYTITRSVFGDSIVFLTAPPANAQIVVRISNEFAVAISSVVALTGNGTTASFDLGVSGVLSQNMIVILDGIIQVPSLNYGMGTMPNGNSTIVFNTPPGSGVKVICHIYSGIGSPIFNITRFVGDGVEDTFLVTDVNQTNQTLFSTFDGVLQNKNEFTLQQTGVGTNVTYETPPANGVNMTVWSTISPAYTRMVTYQFTGNGTTTEFLLTGIGNGLSKYFIVSVNGVCQVGDYTTGFDWSIPDKKTLTFTTAPPADASITVVGIMGVVGSTVFTTDGLADNTSGNLGGTGPDTTSCMVTYLGEDVDMWVADVLRYEDGYTNTTGLQVRPTDKNQLGFYDRPFIFHELVIEDGHTDLVLWARGQKYGENIWVGINQLTTPKGTYGYSNVAGKPILNGALASSVANGDVHYDQATDKWLIANVADNKWELAENQADYKKAVGRDHLRFEWFHYAPESQRIDPSPGNLHDVYLLTSVYDTAVRSWIAQGAQADMMPFPPSDDSLQIQYAAFNDYKTMSDSTILHTMRYKPLFGPSALPQLQGVFKLIQTPGSTAAQNDLALRVLNALSTFFEASRWEAGSAFYFTELCAFIHTQLAPDIQTVVLVPTFSNYAFGRMFQVQAEPEELFISTATLNQIEFIDALSDEDLRIGTFSG